MDQWIIFGSGNYLSDIFDLIHANNGRVKAVVNNVPKSLEELDGLHKRVKSLDYPVDTISLNDFIPAANEKYTLGFMQGRETFIRQIKRETGLTFSSLLHPASCIGSNVEIGEGVIVAPGVVIAPNVVLGDFAIINRSASVGHDTRIGEYCSIAPGVNIGGMSIIGKNVVIGIGAAVINNILIGTNAIIGAGSVVVKDIPASMLAMGVPAKTVREVEV